jgi:hypothetical protein
MHTTKRRSLKFIALVACLPLVTVVAGAATLYPQTPEGAQRWIAKQWTEQLARTDTGGGVTGVTSSAIGVTGFDHPSKIRWSVYGLAGLSLYDVTDPSKPRLIVIGSPSKMTEDVALNLAHYLSPAIARELQRFQDTHTDEPITKITRKGKTQEWRGFGHFEVKNEAGEVIVAADVTSIKITD